MNVLVLSMTTWGEMGNWLSGRTLTHVVKARRPEWSVTQLPVDKLVPELAEVGARIRHVTMTSGSARENTWSIASIASPGLRSSVVTP